VRNVEIFTRFAEREPEGKPRRIVMRFLSSPIELRGEDKLESIVIGRNELQRDDSGRVRAVDTGEREEIECGVVFRSIGYLGTGLEGLPFDERGGVLPNDHGRVHYDGEQIPGLYVVGWIKRGPSGVIGTNKKDAQDTVSALFEDLEAGRIPEPSGDTSAETVEALVAERNPDVVSFGGWRAIDTEEVGRGEPLGRPRVKFCSIAEMVEAARSGDAVSSG
jgi:ferredoxin--NADP+ reductase